MPEAATGLELAKMILATIAELEDNPYEIGASMLRKDVEEIF